VVEHAVVVNVSRYRAAPGMREELLAAMRQMAARAGEEEECFGAQTCSSDRDPDALVAMSRWRSEDALSRFHETAASVAEREHLSGLLAAAPEHENLTTL
jgi:quinol monooxygenase YgiN